LLRHVQDHGILTALFPRLAERRDQGARSLSGGEQQMLSIGRALMTNPRLLVLDEATEGLAPVVRQEIWAALMRLKTDTGLALIVVDKSLAELSRIADHAVIVERGRSVWTGSMTALDKTVADTYLGV
jgi:branched-chain amino acid transport system ATP-binding protein